MGSNSECYSEYQKALRAGRLIRPAECSKCGDASKDVHGHHEDYAKPLDITWLCQRCHNRKLRFKCRTSTARANQITVNYYYYLTKLAIKARKERERIESMV